MEYQIFQISPDDKIKCEQMNRLLETEGIMRDSHLSYSVGLFDENDKIAATGSCFGNTLRCLAVSHEHQGENLMAEIVTHLAEHLAQQGITHLFLFTKCSAAVYFRQLGFYDIASIPGKVVFMENRRDAFERYLQKLKNSAFQGTCSAIVMNANPFTTGHLFLVEKAAAENENLLIFVVSSDISLVPFHDRLAMVKAACKSFPNVRVVPGGDYIISSATFPSYFLKEPKIVTETHAELDSILFVKIAQALNISCRYVGEEPFSETTAVYNRMLGQILPENGINLKVIPRAEKLGTAISASHVRQLIRDGYIEEIKPFVPETTYDYLTGENGKSIIERIQSAPDVIHH